jgi:hypothetical protein
MAELKTKPTRVSVASFIKAIPEPGRRQDCMTLLRIMKAATRAEPVMWGPSIVGFGKYHYKYASGHEGDMCLTGFSPRAQALTIYIVPGFDRYKALMDRLGKHKTGKSCLYIKRLSDVDLSVLKELVTASVKHMKSR